MDGIAVFFLVTLGCFFGVWFVLTFTQWFRRRQLTEYANRAGLAVPDDLEARIEHHVIALERSTAGGALVGVFVGLGLVWMLPRPDYSTESPIVLATPVACTAVILGSMIARAVTAVALTVRQSYARRIARSTTPHLVDYVPAAELAGVCLAVGGSASFFVLSRLAVRARILEGMDLKNTSASFGSIDAMLAYVAVGSAFVGALLCQMVLRAPQRAGSKQELAWDDALRVTTLRSMIAVPIIWGADSLYMNFLEVVVGGTWHPTALEVIAGLIFAAIAAVAIVLVVADRRAKPDEYFLQRLWRDTELVSR